MNIVVDGFGGDHSPDEILKGCVEAVDELGVDITLVGDVKTMKDVFAKFSLSEKNITFHQADSILTMDDAAKSVIKDKKDSSMAVSMKLVADGMGDAIVTAGSTGAAVIGGTFIVKRIKGVKRAAIAPIMPSKQGPFMIIDGGANAEVRPEVLDQFAIIGSAYMKYLFDIPEPRVGLANIGAEKSKGTPLQIDTYQLLKKNDKINFLGNCEGRDIPSGDFDVIIADGFTGNIILKLTEGVASFIVDEIKSVFKTNFITKIAALLVMKNMKAFKAKLDYTEYGGAPIMGLTKPVIKAHGSSNAKAIKNAIKQAEIFAKSGIIEEIETNISSKDYD